MKIWEVKNPAGLAALLKRLGRKPTFAPGQEAAVKRVVDGVRRGGDAALLRYAARFDGTRLKAKDLRVRPQALRAAYTQVEPGLIKAMKTARASIAAFQRRILPSSWRSQARPGVMLGQLVRPVKRVGLCVPGGAAPLISTVLMCAVPAKVAGVPELVLVTPNRGGRGIDPRLLVAADLCGVDEIYQVGGAHAVAALAFGTASIPKVDKIVGPGSSWVMLAQKAVFGQVGIDQLPGPSEILIVADESASPRLLAADLLAQAEHGGEESAVLVTTSRALAGRVAREILSQAARLSRKDRIRRSLSRFGLVILVKTLQEALQVANAKAPEHLELMVRDPEACLSAVKNAGAVFLGSATPEAVGDYLAGPSHVLPTGSTARFSSGLSAESFIKRSSLLRYTRQALRSEEEAILSLARAEGLTAHAASVLARRA